MTNPPTALVNKRTVQKRCLERVERWADQPDQPITDIHEVEARLKTIQRVFTEYMAIQTQIEDEAPTDLDRDDFESRYETLEAKLNRIKTTLAGNQPQDLLNQSLNQTFNPNLNVTIDHQDEMAIQRPKPFYGEDYLEWPTFFNSFTTLIHDSRARNLTPAKKFAILRECVKGKAYDAIKHLPLNETGYDEARNILVKRYDKKRLVFESMIQKLFQIPKANKDSELRDVYDKTTSLTKALEALPASMEQIGLGILIQLILQKVDGATLSRWEDKGSNADQLADWSEFVEFIDERCNTIEAIAFTHKTHSDPKPKPPKSSEAGYKYKKQSYLTETVDAVDENNEKTPPKQCKGCNGNCQTIMTCPKFLELPVPKRFRFLKKRKLCCRCLIDYPHTFMDCPKRCGKDNCNLSHHELLHDDNFSNNNKSASTIVEKNVSSQSTGTNTAALLAETKANELSASPQVDGHKTENKTKMHLLATALVKVDTESDEFLIGRALIDSGSMVNFITKRFASMAKLKFVQQRTDMKGMFGEQKLKYITNVEITSRNSNYSTGFEAIILPKFDDCHPCVRIDEENLNIPTNIKEALADPQFYVPAQIDMILGVGVSYEILSIGQMQMENGLILQNTLLGWIAAGDIVMTGKPIVNNSCFLATLSPSLTPEESELLKRFWELEEARPPTKVLSKDEEYCERLFSETISRTKEGRFIVTIPFKRDPSVLGESRSSAASYLRAIEKKLDQQPVLKTMYAEFIEEYHKLGHMSLVPDDEIARSGLRYNYIPHHYVTKWESSTTKLRVVFHASYNTTSGHSFNSIQCVGPTIQPNLFDIVLRARLSPILICADVTKMYRQILVDPKQRHYQCILWRAPDGRLVTYQLSTITYGTASASFNAVRCLIELTKLYPQFKLAVKAVTNSMYIDDLITGAETIDQGKQLISELNELLSLGGFPLRKWSSNEPEVLVDIPKEHQEPLVCMGEEMITKTLGLAWSPKSDSFIFTHKIDDECKEWTKRKVLSTIARIFDPLGLLGPVTAKAKMLLQYLCKLDLPWDKTIDQRTLIQWLKFIDEMKDLTELKFPRFVMCKSKPKRIELHCFADASTKAYGAVFYLKCIDEDGTVTIFLLCAKSKVAPIQTVTLPRLELCGAVLLAELYTTVTTAMNLKIDKVYCWLDAKVALRWVTSSPHLWKDFIAARTAKIQEKTVGCEWRHIPGELNPADIISRGASPKALAANEMWFNGPEFLKTDESDWTLSVPEPVNDHEEIMEPKNETFTLVSFIQKDLVVQLKSIKYFSRIKTIFAHVHRFINNQCKGIRDNSPLTAVDLENGVKLAVKSVQVANFPKQRDSLIKNKELSVSDPVAKLAPFIDEDKLIRVGGRLKNSPHLTWSEKYPILLPKGHPLNRAIFYNYHVLNLHPGPQALLALVRSKFWPISGMAMANQVFRSCKICAKAKPILFKQIMGNLPVPRISFTRAFETTGVDLFGPFTIKESGRGSRRSEIYAAIFKCFATKAVFLTYVRDASTASFLNAFQRFISCRAIPDHMWSDNGTNLVGASEVMKHIDWKQVDTWARDYKAVQWHFIPPRSPHFGGLWESGVKLAKAALMKVISHTPMNLDAFITLLKRIEGELNSRPITPLVNDPANDRPLTPADFLATPPMTTLPEPITQNFPRTKINLIKHWQDLNEKLSHWRKRWSTELMQSYQSKGKWYVGSSEVKVNRLVFLPNPAPGKTNWLIGRVKELHPGNDGVVRVVTVVLDSGSEYRRSVIQLAPVPVEESSEEAEG